MNFLLALIFSINIAYSGDITFIANEGNYGASNGTISMVFEDGSIVETEPLGDVVQALEVYGNKFEDPMRRTPSIEKIVNATNYEPSMTIQQMIDEIIEYKKINL